MASNIQAVGHLIKRSVASSEINFSFEALQNGDGSQQGPPLPMPTAATVLTFVLSYLALIICVGLVRYTLWGVVGTLAAVEQPQRAVLINGYRDDDVNKPADPVVAVGGEEGVIVNEEPKTSSIRATIRHLHRQGGWKSRYRGITLYIVYVLVASLLTNVVVGILGEIFRVKPDEYERSADFIGILGAFNLVGVTITAIVLTRLNVAWTHIVISEPSFKTWIRRLPPWRVIKQVALPTLAAQLADAVTLLIPCIVGIHMVVAKPSKGMILGAELTGLLLFFVLAVFVKLPCHVAATRVYASLLPAEFDTIVPFDRTFGGKVVPKEAGGSGVLSWRDALSTFTAEARRRLVRLYAKIILIDIGLILLVAVTIVVEVMVLFSPQIKWLQEARKHQN